MSKTSFFKNKS